MSASDFASKVLAAIGGNDEAQAVTQFINTGDPELNRIMSGRRDGGLPVGRMVEVFAESSTGKTALATEWMARVQNEMGGVAGFIDWERSFSVELAEGGFNLNPHDRWIYKRPRTWEEGNMFAAKACQAIRAAKVIPADAPILFVFDSIAAALPKSQTDKEMDEYTMNDTTALARVTSTTLKVMAQHAADFNACFLYLNQIRLKPGVVYGDPRTTPGGKAMEFYATVRLALGREKIMQQVAGSKEFVGQKVNVQCVKSKLTKPFQETSMRMVFDEAGVARFDYEYSMIERLMEDKILPEPRKGFTEWKGTQYSKKQLAEKIRSEGAFAELVALNN